MQISERSGRPYDLGAAEMFYGYCSRTQRFRMMDLEEFLNNVREGYERMWGGAEPAPGRWSPAWSEERPGWGGRRWREGREDCRCHGKASCDCHCECCVCDADVLVHARCSERRRISLTFENDTRREREVKLTLGAFSTSGGTDLGWRAELSTTELTLRACDSQTVLLDVQVNCGKLAPSGGPIELDSTERREPRTVDHCVVGYSTVRAEGCLTRPVVVAVAVLPDDCYSHTAHCGCNCC
jgi:hypothetical protein